MAINEEAAFWSATRQAKGIRDGEFSSRELLELMVSRIESINPKLNAVVTMDLEQARVMAGDLIIVARARYRRVVTAIEKAGADHVLSEEGVIGTVMGSTIVSLLDLEVVDAE